MEEFPSGQRGQTVNLLRLASVVRIHPPPPRQSKRHIACSDFLSKSERAHSAALPSQTEPAPLGFGLAPPPAAFLPGDPFKGCRFSLIRWIRKPALSGAPVARRNRRGFSAEKRIHPPPPRQSKRHIACSDFLSKSERAHSAALPSQTEPAALGFGLAPPPAASFPGDPFRVAVFLLSGGFESRLLAGRRWRAASYYRFSLPFLRIRNLLFHRSVIN